MDRGVPTSCSVEHDELKRSPSAPRLLMRASHSFVPGTPLLSEVVGTPRCCRQRSRCLQLHCSLHETVLRDIKELGFHPKRALGQNFVVSEKAIQDIVACAGVQEGDAVLEIGPGLGSLTDALVTAGAAVLAIEKDDVLHAHLRKQFDAVPALQLVHGDVLDIQDMPELLASFSKGVVGRVSKLKVVANIPYNITSSLLKRLLPLKSLIGSMHLLLEEGAARRLVEAVPGDKDYRAMNIFIDYHAKTRCCIQVGRDMFYPRPHVDSLVAEFLLLPEGDLGEEQEPQFFRFVDRSFIMKRKTLANNLRPLYEEQHLHQCMSACNIPLMNRAEALELADFIRLFKCLRNVNAGG